MKAMILAAGKGTRLKPITDHLPKALLKINGKTLLQYQIEKLQDAGIREIIINVHHHAQQIKDYVTKNSAFGCKIFFSDETAQLLETGGGLLHARKFLQDVHHEPFIVCNVDILQNLNYQVFADAFAERRGIAQLVVSERTTQRYFLFDERLRLRGWKNIATGEIIPENIDIANLTAFAFAGTHIISPDIFPYLEAYAKENGNVFSITSFYLWLMKMQDIYAFVPKNYRMMDVGKIEQLDQAEAFLQRS